MISQSRINEVCDNLIRVEANPNLAAVPKIAAQAVETVRHLERNIYELLEVVPDFPALIEMTKNQINQTKKPGTEDISELEVETLNSRGEVVSYDQVPKGSKPYMEVLRLYVSLRRREGPVNN